MNECINNRPPRGIIQGRSAEEDTTLVKGEENVEDCICAKKYRTKIQLLLLALIFAALKRYCSAVKWIRTLRSLHTALSSPAPSHAFCHAGLTRRPGHHRLGRASSSPAKAV